MSKIESYSDIACFGLTPTVRIAGLPNLLRVVRCLPAELSCVLTCLLLRQGSMWISNTHLSKRTAFQFDDALRDQRHQGFLHQGLFFLDVQAGLVLGHRREK
jgi:hypothetical protein